MNCRTRLSVLIALLWITAPPVRAQTVAAKEQPAGSIAGRVVNGDRPLPAITVVIYPAEPRPNLKPIARVMTDQDGRYQITGIGAGRYQVLPIAPSFTVLGVDGWPPGRPINLAAGETAEGFDFSLARGGVITGRVTDAQGKPVIAERVTIENSAPGGRRPFFFGSQPGMMTDDRGVYRIYGLPAGKYRVSAGDDNAGGNSYRGNRHGFYERVFYPGTSDVAQAKLVEVIEGREATDIDITLGARAETYKAVGRVITEDGGQPVPNVSLGYGKLEKNSAALMDYDLGVGMQTNARGEFSIENIPPGRYGAFVALENAEGFYSDIVTFEITDGDVQGLEIRLRQGATISGSVYLEGATDPAVAARLLSQVSLYADTAGPDQLSAPRWAPARVAPDGSFLMTGLRPGKVRINLANWPPVKGLTLMRVDHNGIEQGDGLNIAGGEHLTGVRAVVAYGTGIVRGQVNVTGGVLPEGTRMMVQARRGGAGGGSGSLSAGYPAVVDARGRFTLEGLAAGDYELSLNILGPPGADRRLSQLRQIVTINHGGEATAVFLVDLGEKTKGELQ